MAPATAPGPTEAGARSLSPGRAKGPPPLSPPARALGWLGFGAGSVPGDYQISIAQDLALARETFAAPGRLFFGSGPGASVSQTRAGGAGDPLVGALGDLLAPRGGRGETYVPAPLAIDEPATPAALHDVLAAQLDVATSAPLVVYVAGHGDQGAVAAWPQATLRVDDLAAWSDSARGARPWVLISTTCFGGSFSALAFTEGKVELGGTSQDRCGLFATTADLPADGCDPNPDRRQQEGYGIYFLNALRGRDRFGAPVPRSRLDLDGDGRISLLEAHAHARMTSRSGNVPTTTSERYLREVAPPETGAPPRVMAEDMAVARALAARLGVGTVTADTMSELRARVARELARMEARIELANRALDAAQAREDAAYRETSGALLARWPVLDDPWHPDYERTLTRAAGDISRWLQASRPYRRYLDADGDVASLDSAVWNLRIQAAPWENLLRALDTQLLAGRLAARGGAAWDRYLRFLACERAVVPTR